MHVEQPLLQDQFVFGWLNGKRVILPAYVDYYCDKLIELLSNQKTRLRWMAADQLGKLRYPNSVPFLIIALQDSHWLVRLHAAKSLGRIGDKKALLSLVEVFKDPNLSVRRQVITALGNWGKEEIVFGILALAADNPDKDIRARVAMSLIGVDNQNAVNILIKLIQDKDKNVSWRAVTAIKQSNNILATEPLIELLGSSDAGLVYRVIKALGYLGDKRALKSLEQMSKHENKTLSARAKFSLNQIESARL